MKLCVAPRISSSNAVPCRFVLLAFFVAPCLPAAVHTGPYIDALNATTVAHAVRPPKAAAQVVANGTQFLDAVHLGPTRSKARDTTLRSEPNPLEVGDVPSVSVPEPQPESEQTLASIMAIDANMQGDLIALMVDIVTTVCMVSACVIFMSFVRLRFPMTYSYNVLKGDVPFEPENSLFGWMKASWSLTCSDAVQSAGLDQAMLLRYQEFCFKILVVIGVPFATFLCPFHYFVGGGKADKDNLSKVGVANDQDHIKVWWVNACSVWYVVVVVQYFLFTYQRSFMSRRFAWLQNMPEPRSKTALVTGIPYEYCTDERLKEYFQRMFKDPNAVQAAFVVKHTRFLKSKIDEYHEAKDELAKVQAKWLSTGKDPNQRPMVWVSWSNQDALTYYSEVVKSLRHECKQMREVLMEKSEAVAARFEQPAGDGEHAQFKQFLSKFDESIVGQYITTEGIMPNTTNGFVTFSSRHYKEMALNLTFRADEEEFRCQVPPAPSDVIYKSFMSDEAAQRIYHLIGYFWIFATFAVYMPYVMKVSMYTNMSFLAERFPFFERIQTDYPIATDTYNGLMCSLGIDIFMGMLPTLLSFIINTFWEPQANAYLQIYIQNWYFYFLVTFVLLVTGVGNSLYERLVQLAHQPMEALDFFFSAMPRATHFYMNYMVLNNVTQAMVLTRYINLLKYIGYRLFYDPEGAHQRSEPEDPDYYGIGSRSARFSLMFAICLVFSTLAPLITVLGMMYFGLCRLFYGYLLVFAESRKADLGGFFWQQQLKHVQVSVYIYIALMAGVCSARGPIWTCGLVPLSAGVFHFVACARFDAFRWYSLPFEAAIFIGNEEEEAGSPKASSPKMAADGPKVVYCQPELIEDLDAGCEDIFEVGGATAFVDA